MHWKTIIERITVTYPQMTITGPIEYSADHSALCHIDEHDGAAEVLSIDLRAYGYVPGLAEVFIKDWSEHQGFAAALHEAGLVDLVEEIVVGPFSSLAFRVRILTRESPDS